MLANWLKVFPRSLAKSLYYTINAPMIRRRRQARDSMPYVKLALVHTSGGMLLPSRTELLERMKKSAVVAEIGVANGDFSADILQICTPKRLDLIDAWHTEQYAGDSRIVEDRFSDQIKAGAVVINRGLSVDVLKKFAAETFDWVYVDTNHSYETTAEELIECERVVRGGGRILGHDFCLGNIVKPAVFGVIQATNEFCLNRNWQYEYVTLESDGYLSFCLKKIP